MIDHDGFDMGMLAYNLLHLLHEFYLDGEEVKRSVEWLIRRLIKVASRISYHSRYWWCMWLLLFRFTIIIRQCLGMVDLLGPVDFV